MVFNRLTIKNYKIFQSLDLELNKDINIIVGDNESGKTTILEAIALTTSGRIRGRRFESFLSKGIFNNTVVDEYLASLETGAPKPPPAIEIELYAENLDEYAKYKGKNNSRNEDLPGISFIIEFNNALSDAYEEAIKAGIINDIPLEFYHYTWKSFSGQAITSFNNPITTCIIDTAQVNDSVVDSFIGQEIKDVLTEDEIRKLSSAYRNSRNGFSNDAVLVQLNERMKKKADFKYREVEIALNAVSTQEWQKELSLKVDSVPLQLAGRGTQNAIKTNLALRKEISEKAVVLLIEEPENNLSYTNMAKMISEIIENNTDKQIFVATHSSFVANKLGLNKMIMLSKKSFCHLSALPIDTIDYFRKLPGYDTLRLVVASKTVLVEGPTDELIVQGAYLKKTDRLPIDDGIDIIAVRSLAFQRFCDIAVLLKKHIVILTDNDGDIKNNILKKYEKYDHTYVNVFSEQNEALNTLEPSFVEANNGDIRKISEIILGEEKSKEELIDYMSKHKTEWALKVFDAAKNVSYPEYIENALSCVEK